MPSFHSEYTFISGVCKKDSAFLNFAVNLL